MYNLTLWLARLILHNLGYSNRLLPFHLNICRQYNRVLRTMCELNSTACLLVLQTSKSSVTKETQRCLLFSIVVEIKKTLLFIPPGMFLKVYTISLEESAFILI